MANIEHFLCMGLHRGADPTRMGEVGATGDCFPRWEDCNAAVGLLTRLERGAVGVRVAPHLLTGDELAEFTNHLWLRLIHFDNKSRTYGELKHDDARQASIVRTAIEESITPKTCRTCLRSRETGKVQQYVEGQGVVSLTCPKCQGAGWMPWSDTKRSKGVGCTRDDWPRFAAGYDLVLRECSAQYKSASDRFMFVLFGDDSIAAA